MLQQGFPSYGNTRECYIIYLFAEIILLKPNVLQVKRLSTSLKQTIFYILMTAFFSYSIPFLASLKIFIYLINPQANARLRINA